MQDGQTIEVCGVPCALGTGSEGEPVLAGRLEGENHIAIEVEVKPLPGTAQSWTGTWHLVYAEGGHISTGKQWGFCVKSIPGGRLQDAAAVFDRCVRWQLSAIGHGGRPTDEVIQAMLYPSRASGHVELNRLRTEMTHWRQRATRLGGLLNMLAPLVQQQIQIALRRLALRSLPFPRQLMRQAGGLLDVPGGPVEVDLMLQAPTEGDASQVVA